MPALGIHYSLNFLLEGSEGYMTGSVDHDEWPISNPNIERKPGMARFNSPGQVESF